MVNSLELILSGMIMSFTCHFIWKKLLDIKLNSMKCIFSLIIIALSLFVNYYFNNNYIKISCITLVFIIVIRIFFSKNLKQSVIAGLITEFMFIVSELIFSVIMLAIFRSDLEFVMTTYFGSLLTNFVVCFISIILCLLKLPKKLYKKLLGITNKLKLSHMLFVTSVLIVSFNIFLMLPYYQLNTLVVVILNAGMMAIYSYIVFRFIKEKNRYIEINDKYSLTESSLKELQSNVNRLMALNHENKNQLKMIRTMVANKDKNILNSIDVMIEQKIKEDKELKEKTSVISNTMIGALIYSKMLTMKEKEIHYDLHIEKTISKVEFINLGDKNNVDICKVLGVYLDNAIEATLETKEKDVSIQIYMEEEDMIIFIANNFVGNVDLDAIEEYGYTTKTEGHGYGLSLVKEILKENKSLSSETEISNNIFIQKLKIKM